jgi:hypothetical protein
MPQAEFETTIIFFELSKALHILNRVATEIGCRLFHDIVFVLLSTWCRERKTLPCESIHSVVNDV